MKRYPDILASENRYPVATDAHFLFLMILNCRLKRQCVCQLKAYFQYFQRLLQLKSDFIRVSDATIVPKADNFMDEDGKCTGGILQLNYVLDTENHSCK